MQERTGENKVREEAQSLATTFFLSHRRRKRHTYDNDKSSSLQYPFWENSKKGIRMD